MKWIKFLFLGVALLAVQPLYAAARGTCADICADTLAGCVVTFDSQVQSGCASDLSDCTAACRAKQQAERDNA